MLETLDIIYNFKLERHMVKDIIQIGDQRLLEESEEIDPKKISTGEIQDLARDLMETLNFHKKRAAGLSAVQLGILKRMHVIKRVDLDKDKRNTFEVLINPKIKVKGSKTSMEWEGCMSINTDNRRLFGPVARPKEIIVEYLDLKGEKQKLRAKDFFSHLLQHEQDHLDGKLFLSYIDNPKNIWKEDELDKYLEEYGKFPEVIKG